MIVLALDLSLRSTGVVAVPHTFAADLDWSTVEHAVITTYALPQGASVVASIGRILAIEGQVIQALERIQPDMIALEEQAFSQRGAHARELGELTGVVKAGIVSTLAGMGKPLLTVTASTARKTLLGKVPRVGAKERVHEVLTEMGAPWVDRDRSDAFVIANHVLSTHGYPAVTVR